MKLVYVAGPYRDKCEHGVVQNIRRAEEITVQLWAAGYAVICPHKNTALLGGALGMPDQIWLDGDIVMLKRCDMLVVCPGWEESTGTHAEVEAANAAGIPIYFWEDRDHQKFLLGKN